MTIVRGLVFLFLILTLAAVLAPRWGPASQVPPWLREARWGIFGKDPDELYRVAERYFQAGDFERSEMICEKALKREPHHAPASALLMEVQFNLGRGFPTPNPVFPGSVCLCKHTQTLVEIDNALALGKRCLDARDFLKAEKEYRKILEYVKWMPVTVETQAKAEEARAALATLKRVGSEP